MLAWPKWKSYTLPSRDNIHIFRDPPKSIHTRKKERVEFGDVEHWLREDESRIDENIKMYARGVNPSVEVSYSNHGNPTHSLNIGSASNPYKVNKSFRPPIFRQADLRPLSRLPRPYISGTTNPGVRGSFVDCGLNERMDHTEAKAATSVAKLGEYYPKQIRPTAVFTIEKPIEISARHAIKEDLLYAAGITNPQGDHIDNETARYYDENRNYPEINNNYQVENLFTNPSDQRDHNLLNKNMNARTTDRIQVSGYAMPTDHTRLKNSYNPEYKLERNTPEHSMSAFATDHNKLKNSYDPKFELVRNLPMEQMYSSITGDHSKQGEYKQKNLRRRLDMEGNSSNIGSSIMLQEVHDLRDGVKLDKFVPHYNFENPGVAPKYDGDRTVKLKDKSYLYGWE